VKRVADAHRGRFVVAVIAVALPAIWLKDRGRRRAGRGDPIRGRAAARTLFPNSVEGVNLAISLMG
jgi:hypothetical protein